MFEKLKIDKELLARATEHAKQQGYSSVSEFVSHLIERELSADGPADADAAKSRLKGLGYID